MYGSISKIETMGLADGPGIRTVIFFNGCKLRCKFCHNPETWLKKDNNVSLDELVSKILRFKNYYGKDGGVTLSGGEPLLQSEFILELCKRLKQEQIHIALDTSGVGISQYEEILSYIDLVILDIKHFDSAEYKNLTGLDMSYFLDFINYLNDSNKPVWIRQVIVPNYNDNLDYIDQLCLFLKKINNIENIELLPYHNMAISKYDKLGINYPLKNVPNMDKFKCLELEKYLQTKRDF